MILIVDFNPLLEELILLRNFSVGSTHKSENNMALPGGSGIRVARSIMNLGERVVVSGFNGGKTGQNMKLLMFKEGIPFNFIDTKSEIQTNRIILDLTTGIETSILTADPKFTKKDISQFRNLYKSLSTGMKVICFTGSIPQKFPDDIFFDLIANHRGRKTLYFVYADAHCIQSTVKAHPFLSMIKQSELEIIAGAALPDRNAIIEAVRTHINPSLGFVVVFPDSGEAILISESSACFVKTTAPATSLKKVGREEAFIGGMIIGQLQTSDVLQALKYGMAAQIASSEILTISGMEKAAIQRHLEFITIEPC